MTATLMHGHATKVATQYNTTHMNATVHRVQRKANVAQLDEKENWMPLHSGVVTGETTTHYRVFDPKSDVGPWSSEWFPKESRRIRTVVL